MATFCAKQCKECPFSKESLSGWLGGYSIEDLQNMMNQEALFPCHLMVHGEDLTQEEVAKGIELGHLKLCRGYVESMIKSCKMPRYNKVLMEAREKVKAEGLSENSMSLWEFVEHHKKFIKK